MIEITDKIEFSETVHKAVDFFVTGEYPKKTEHIKWLHSFLESHNPIPKEDLLCKEWNRVGTDSKRGQITTPLWICDFMNKETIGKNLKNKKSPIHICDPCCGSGVFAISAYNLYHKSPKWKNCYFQQVDIDPLAVRMTILNLMVRNFHALIWEADFLMGNTKNYEKYYKKLPQAWYLHPQKKISSVHKLTQKEATDTWDKWYGKDISSKRKGYGTDDKQGVLFEVSHEQTKKENVKKTIKRACNVNTTNEKQMPLF